MKNLSYFLVWSEAKEFAKNNKGSNLKLNPSGKGWIVESKGLLTNQVINNRVEKKIVPKPKKNVDSSDGWFENVKGNLSKQTSYGLFGVIKVKGEWHLMIDELDVNHGFAFQSSKLAIQKAEKIISERGSPKIKKLTTENIVDNLNTKDVIHISIATKPTSKKLVAKKIENLDGIGGSRDQVKKMRGWKLS
jgi:hypothetical protein